MSKLFDDASLAMIPSAYSDGRLYSIRPIPELGSELNPNVDFSSDTDWTHARGNWAISGGTLNTSSESDYCFVDIGDQSSKTLRIEYDIVSHSSGNVQIRLFGATTKYGTARDAVGTYVEYIDVPAGHNGSIGFQGFSSFTGALDNVSFKVVSNNGDFTFSRGSNLAATRVDVNGLIEKGRENQLLQSNSFDTLPWINAGTTDTGGQAGYDGTNDAWLITKVSANGRMEQSVSSSGVNTLSVYAKANASDWALIQHLGGGNPYAFFNLSTGEKGALGGGAIDSEIESIGNGWYKLSITSNVTISQVRIYPSEANTTSGTSGSIYIQDAQLEAGLVATDYIETGASTAQAGILEDMPRLDYSGGASCPALLLEPQRTNLVPYSEYFGTSDWVKLGVGTGSTPVITYNYAESPEGLNNATRIQLDLNGGTSSGDQSLIYDDLGAKTGDHTRSVYIKSLTTDTDLYFGGTLNDKKTITATTEWQRFDFTSDLSAQTLYVTIGLRGTTGSSDVADILVWGFQAESGSYPTSYIPTYGASVTRSGESCVATSVSDLIGQEQGTLFVEAKSFVDVYPNNTYTSITNSTGSNRIIIGIASQSNQLRIVGVFGGVSNGGNNYTLSDTTNYFKVAIKYYGSTLDVFINGVKETSQSFGGFSNSVDAVRFDDGNGALPFQGNVKQRLIFPTALTDSECIALTTI